VPQQFFFEGTPGAKNPFTTKAPFSLKIMAVFGDAQKTIKSETGNLFISDPCFHSQIIDRTLNSMVYVVNKAAVIQEIDAFKDTVSQLYSADFGDGSGYDICAPQELFLFEEIGQSNWIQVPFASVVS